MDIGDWNSEVEAINAAERSGHEARVEHVYRCNNDSVLAVFLKLSSGRRLCVPYRINTKVSLPQEGDIIKPKFGDVYFGDAICIKDKEGASHRIEQWEAPTMYLIL